MRESRERPATVSRENPSDPSPACDVCGGPTYELRCKIICLRCGFTRDCSDP